MNEIEWIKYLTSRVSTPEGFIGIGDDAAILSNGTVVSMDTFVENVHFKSAWSSWRKMGRKMAVAAISDISAMGAACTAMLATLSTAEGESVAKEILEGLLDENVPLIGGDTTSGKADATTITIAVIGNTYRPVLRSGARPGETIYLSGPIGGSLGGLTSLQNERHLTELEKRFLEPSSRQELGQEWGSNAGAMIDISDGLVSELYHLAGSSNVRMNIDLDAIPLFPGLDMVTGNPLALAMESGEEFELLATSSVSLKGGTAIGKVEVGSGVYSRAGEIPRSGYVHRLG